MREWPRGLAGGQVSKDAGAHDERPKGADHAAAQTDWREGALKESDRELSSKQSGSVCGDLSPVHDFISLMPNA